MDFRYNGVYPAWMPTRTGPYQPPLGLEKTEGTYLTYLREWSPGLHVMVDAKGSERLFVEHAAYSTVEEIAHRRRGGNGQDAGEWLRTSPSLAYHVYPPQEDREPYAGWNLGDRARIVDNAGSVPATVTGLERCRVGGTDRIAVRISSSWFTWDPDRAAYMNNHAWLAVTTD